MKCVRAYFCDCVGPCWTIWRPGERLCPSTWPSTIWAQLHSTLTPPLTLPHWHAPATAPLQRATVLPTGGARAHQHLTHLLITIISVTDISPIKITIEVSHIIKQHMLLLSYWGTCLGQFIIAFPIFYLERDSCFFSVFFFQDPKNLASFQLSFTVWKATFATFNFFFCGGF